MAEPTGPAPTLGAAAARQLANTTKTPPQWIGTTPRWLVSLLPWVPVEAGTYRVNNANYGLLTSVAPEMRVTTRGGAPTPDDLDELLTKVWKEPAFFLAHPRAIAAFGRECTRRGVPPPTATLFGSPFLTWRGVPLIPSNKLHIKDGGSNILLLRTGERKQGAVGLFQPGIPGE